MHCFTALGYGLAARRTRPAGTAGTVGFASSGRIIGMAFLSCLFYSGYTLSLLAGGEPEAQAKAGLGDLICCQAEGSTDVFSC